MMDKKTPEIKRAKKIVARIFQRNAVIIFIILLPLIAGGVISLQGQNQISEIFSTIFIVLSFTYLLDLLMMCLSPYLTIIRMINGYTLDATDQKELIRRLKVISEIIRFNLLFDGKITLGKIAKESRITKIDVSLFKGINHLSISDVNDKIINNNIFQFRGGGYIPILNFLRYFFMLLFTEASASESGIIESFKMTTGINVQRLGKPKKKQ